MGHRGPLPTGEAIRRNKPTIPTTSLPVTGRSTPVPPVPTHYELGPKGMDWWEWAWRTPQACAWDDGSLFAVARRAQLEDDLAALAAGNFDLGFLVEAGADDAVKVVKDLISTLKAMAGGKLGIAREMRELDDRLGLTPKGLAQLRWKIVDAEEAPKAEAPKGRRLKAV